jgi:hypothetical protein
MLLIFTLRDISLGVTERAKPELCFYIRRRLEPTPSEGPVRAYMSIEIVYLPHRTPQVFHLASMSAPKR